MKNKFMESKLGKWLKRIIIIVIVMGLVAFGVIKLIENKTSNVEKSALETLESLESYYMEASMDFYKGEDSRTYIVKVSYKNNEDGDLFKVSMFDKAINQEQIILTIYLENAPYSQEAIMKSQFEKKTIYNLQWYVVPSDHIQLIAFIDEYTYNISGSSLDILLKFMEG